MKKKSVSLEEAIKWAKTLCELDKTVISQHKPYLEKLVQAAQEEGDLRETARIATAELSALSDENEQLRARIQELEKQRDIYAQKAAGTCCTQAVIDALGEQTLTSCERYQEGEDAIARLKQREKPLDCYGVTDKGKIDE